MRRSTIAALAVVLVASAVGTAKGQMRITEWMYSGAGGNEFIEFTNIGNTPIDMAGWSFDDADQTPGSVDLSAFGIVNPYESVILTEATDTDFRTAWGLPGTVDVIGGNTNNLGRNDEINLYDNGSALVDRLTFGDQTFPGTIRTQNKSGNPNSLAALGPGVNDPAQWQLSVNGDAYGSYFSIAPAADDLANPGSFTLVPEPSSLLLAGVAGLGTLLAVWRRRRTS
jgi:predicted extracellular nuclease